MNRKIFSLLLILLIAKPSNGMLDFGSTSDYVQIDSSLSLINLNAGTITLWFYKESSSSIDGLYEIRGGELFDLIDFNGTFGINFRASIILGGVFDAINVPSPSINQWHHVAVTWSTAADEFKMYLDGVQAGATQTGLGVPTTPPTESRIGSEFFASDYLDGRMQDFRIYTRALSLAEIQRIYTSRSFILLTDGLVNWLKMDGCRDGASVSGAVLRDYSGRVTASTAVGAPVCMGTQWLNYP